MRVIDANWEGPFSWPGFESENSLPPAPQVPGVYLMTFQCNGDYLIYAAGLTRKTVPTRLRQHTAKYTDGKYNVLDIAAAQSGIRKEIWKGWGYERKNRHEFEERRESIQEAVMKQLIGMPVFVAALGTEPRLLERVEAVVMKALYSGPSPLCDIPDEGMFLAGRWKSEEPIIVRNTCTANLRGLPDAMEI